MYVSYIMLLSGIVLYIYIYVLFDYSFMFFQCVYIYVLHYRKSSCIQYHILGFLVIYTYMYVTCVCMVSCNLK